MLAFESLRPVLESVASIQSARINEDVGNEEFEIELTADLSVSPARLESTTDERTARLELELFEQSEKMTLINRNLLRSQLALQLHHRVER